MPRWSSSSARCRSMRHRVGARPHPSRPVTSSRSTSRTPTTRGARRSWRPRCARPPTFSSAVQLDLGDRAVELIHPGRGHTAGDLVVRVPDADVVLGGDLVEESDLPFIGDDSWPRWPADPRPGARPDDRRDRRGPRAREGRRQGVRAGPEARARRGSAKTIRDLASAWVPQSEARSQGEWLWDRVRLESAHAWATSIRSAARSGSPSSDRVSR